MLPVTAADEDRRTAHDDHYHTAVACKGDLLDAPACSVEPGLAAVFLLAAVHLRIAAHSARSRVLYMDSFTAGCVRKHA